MGSMLYPLSLEPMEGLRWMDKGVSAVDASRSFENAGAVPAKLANPFLTFFCCSARTIGTF